MLFKNIVLEAKKPKIVIRPSKKLDNTDYTEGLDEDAPEDEGADNPDEATDYTEEETAAAPDEDVPEDAPEDEGTDNPDEATDYTKDTDAPEDMGEDTGNPEEEGGDEEEPEDTNKNLALLTDFIQFYRNIKEVIDKIAGVRKANLLLASVLNQVNKNLGILEENVFQFIYRLFPKKKYVENLYQYNCFIEAFKINIEMMKKIKYLDIG